MTGQWLRTKVVDAKAETVAITATYTDTINLPKTNFIGNILVALKGVCVATGTITVNKIEVIGNGAATLVSLSGAQIQKIMSFDYSNRQMAVSAAGVNLGDGIAAAGTETVYMPYIISFGRFIGDTLCMLPAKLFKTLQLKITYSTAVAAWTSLALYVVVDEYVSDEDPATKLILKKTEIEGKATGTGDTDFDLPLGNAYRRLMLYVSACTTVTTISLRANNGAEIPYTDDWSLIQIMNLYDYEMMGTTYTTLGMNWTDNWVMIDLDRSDTLSKAIDTTNLNDLKLRVSRGATTTTAVLVAEEIVSIG